VEAALALSNQPGNRVTISYRKGEFSRLKDRNREKLNDAIKDGRLKALLNSEITEILPKAVIMKVKGETTSLENDFVVVSIGGEPPKDFLQKVGVEVVSKRI
jgi:thioredoxin reductase